MESNESKMETSSAQFNDATLKAQLIHEIVNSAYNHNKIVSAFENGTARDISDEVKADGKPCFILGSGASLDIALPLLKDWKGGIICTTSQALSLMYHGIEPTHILALDPFCAWEEIDGVDWSKTKTKLIAHPGVWPNLIQNWPNEMLFYVENSGRGDSFYNTTQKQMYTWREGDRRLPIFHFYIRTALTLFACSPPAELFVAERLGYGTIFLSGVDFGFTYGKERFSNWVKKDGEWKLNEYPILDEAAVPDRPKLILSNNNIPTLPMHVYYKKNFISGWRLSHQTVYTTDKGTITEIPYVDIKEAIEKQGEGFEKQSIEFIDDNSEKYLASVYCFVVKVKTYNGAEGQSFVEAREPEKDLVSYMLSLKKSYICTKCGTQATATDDIDYDGKICTVCKDGAMKHFHDVNILENVGRFEKALGRKFIIPNHKAKIGNYNIVNRQSYRTTKHRINKKFNKKGKK
jgi:hypothetical protein